MKKVFIIIIFFLCCEDFYSQTWERTYPNTFSVGLNARENEFNPVNGGIVVAMNYAGPPTTNLIRFNSFGDTLWTRKPKLDTANYWFLPEQTATLQNGNYLVCGSGEGVPFSTYGRRFFVMEFTSTGNCTKLYRYPLGEIQSTSIIEASRITNEHFVVYRNDSALPPFGVNTTYKTIINRISSTGTLVWSKKFINTGISSSIDQTTTIDRFKTTLDDGCIFSKRVLGNSTVIQKLDIAGTSTWSVNIKSMLGVTYPMDIWTDDMVCLKDTSYVISCEISNSVSGGSLKSYLLRFDKIGNLTDSVRCDSTWFVGLMENSNGRIIANYVFLKNNTISNSGLMFLDKNLNYLNFFPSPFSLSPSMVGKMSPNNLGGGLFTICYPGFTYIVNFDSLLSTYPYKFNGSLIEDNNKDCVYNSGDKPYKYKTVEFKEALGAKFYTISNGSGSYNATLPVGSYTVQHNTSLYRVKECPASGIFSATVTGVGNNFGNNFYDSLVPNIKDVYSMMFSDKFVPGFNSNVSVYYGNNGTTIVNSQLKLLKDTSLTYVSSNPPVSLISGDTIIYNVSNFNPDSSNVFNLILKTKSTTPLGTAIKLVSEFKLVGDINGFDNTDTIIDMAIGSFDPNDKAVNQPFCFNPSKELVYNIRFQNTGTGPAQNIIIVDTIDNNLDMSTFKLIYSKHSNIKIQWQSNNRLSFRYDGIMLPDSNTNEPASHGELTYSIKAKTGLTTGTVVRNRAHIYFDYNYPITTNLVSNMICPLVTNVSQLEKESRVKIYPNPSSDLVYLVSDYLIEGMELYSLSGNLINKIELKGKTNQEPINISDLSEGLYLIKVITETNSYTKKLVVIH